MFFSNLVSDSGVGTFQRSTRANTNPFVNEFNAGYTMGCVCLEDGKIKVKTDVGSDENELFTKDIKVLQGADIYHEKYGCKYTVGEIKDTEENPIIAVLTDEIRCYEGVKTFIKFIKVSETLFVATLIYGACEFRFSQDGSYIPMQRNNEQDLSNRKVHVFTAKKLYSIVSVIDKESDYSMLEDSVNAVIIDIKNSDTARYKTVHESMFTISDVNLLARRAKAEEKRKRVEAEKQARAERNRLFIEESKRKAQEAEKAALEQQFATPKVRAPKEKKKEATGATGAMAFMEALKKQGYAVKE